MGNEDVVGPQGPPRSQPVIVAEVEQQRLLRLADLHIDARVSEDVIHQNTGA